MKKQAKTMTETECENWYMENYGDEIYGKDHFIERIEDGAHIYRAEENGFTVVDEGGNKL